jgi:hypothetical protein
MVVVVIKLAYATATTSLLGEVMSVVRILLPELLAPTEVQPGRAAMLLERVGWHYCFHAASMPQRAEPV